MEPTKQQPTPDDESFSGPEPVVMSPSPATPGKSRKSSVAISGLVIAAVLVLAVAFAVSRQSGGNQTGTASIGGAVTSVAQVNITDSGFNPATIRIQKGQTVIWINQGSGPHQPATDPYPSENAVPGFVDDVALAKGETYGFKFNQTGTFTYHDHLNPLQLKGTVIVQ